MKKIFGCMFLTSIFLMSIDSYAQDYKKAKISTIQELRRLRKLTFRKDKNGQQKIEIKPQVFIEYATKQPFFKIIDQSILQESLQILYQQQPNKYLALSDLLLRSMEDETDNKIIELKLLVELLSITNSYLKEKYDELQQQLHARPEDSMNLKVAIALALIGGATSAILGYLHFVQ